MAANEIKSCRPLISAFARVYSVFAETVCGIVAALGRGELKTAARLAWLGFVAVAWQGAMLGQWIPGVAYLRQNFGVVVQALFAGDWGTAKAILILRLRLGWISFLNAFRQVIHRK